MKLNFKQLPQLFKKLAGSDMAGNIAKGRLNNVDNVVDMVDDIPTHVSFDDIADTYKWRQTHDINKPPITPAEFKKQFNAELPARQETRDLLKLFPEMGNTAASEADLNALSSTEFGLSEPLRMDNTPDYDAMKINPIDYGQTPPIL